MNILDIIGIAIIICVTWVVLDYREDRRELDNEGRKHTYTRDANGVKYHAECWCFGTEKQITCDCNSYSYAGDCQHVHEPTE